MALIDVAVFLRFLSPVVLFWLAWVVARTPYQERSNRVLAAFLVTVGAGFAIEAVWDLLRATTTSAPNLLLRTFQYYLGLLDPPLLLLFALISGRTRGARNLGPLWVAYTLLGLVLIVAQLGSPFWGNSRLVATASLEVAYTNGTYLAAAAIVVRQYVREPRRYMAAHYYFLSLGIGFAALSRSAAIYWPGGPIMAQGATIPMRPAVVYALSLVTALLLLIVLVVVAQAGQGRAVHSLRPFATRMSMLLVGFFVLLAILYPLSLSFAGQTALDAFAFGYRWLVFGGIAAYGMLRYRLFDFELRARQALQLVGASVVAVATAMLVAAVTFDKS